MGERHMGFRGVISLLIGENVGGASSLATPRKEEAKGSISLSLWRSSEGEKGERKGVEDNLYNGTVVTATVTIATLTGWSHVTHRYPR